MSGSVRVPGYGEFTKYSEVWHKKVEPFLALPFLLSILFILLNQPRRAAPAQELDAKQAQDPSE